jgi:GntR family transcriptional repressor for pyruvate dehydrogenase complex
MTEFQRDEQTFEKGSTGPFRAISGPRAHEEVVEQITFAIRSGIFRPGARLPHVDQLARAMHVSKPTVGEAVKVLSQGGVIVAQRGASGGLTVMSDNIPGTILEIAAGWRDAAPRDLVEARRPIDMEIARLAGRRATDEDLELLEEAVATLDLIDHESDYGRWLHYDHLFHYAMGRAAKSEMLAYYQHQILQQLFVVMQSYFTTEEDPDVVREAHRDTLEAIKSRDQRRIEMSMDRHLSILERQVGAGTG